MHLKIFYIHFIYGLLHLVSVSLVWSEVAVRYDLNGVFEGVWRDASQNGAGPLNLIFISDPDDVENQFLRIETAAGTTQRAKIATLNDELAAGRYLWRVYVPALGENEQASIGAFLWRDDMHEIDFEIYHGKQADRDALNAQENDLIALLIVQNSSYTKQVLIKREQWYVLELNLQVIRPAQDNIYQAEWNINGEQVGEFTLSYGPEVMFAAFCSMENLAFAGDQLPNQVNYALFDYFEFHPQPEVVFADKDRPRDLDADGMSDAWEVVHFGDTTTAIASEDNDGDTRTNLDESAFGTDPWDSRSYLLPKIDFVDSQVRFSWPTVPYLDYRIEFSKDLLQWADIEDVTFFTLNGSVIEYMDNAIGELKFYRLRPANAVDEDGDGLNKWEESMLGTSDTNLDSDGDFMADVYEFNRPGLDAAVVNDFDTALSLALEKDLVAHYSFAEQAGIIVGDGSGNGFDASITGPVGWQIDPERGAVFRFSPINDSVVMLPVHPVLDGLQDADYTLSLWFKPESIPTHDDPTESAFALLMKRGRHNGLLFNIDERFGAELWVRLSDAQPTAIYNLFSAAKTVASWYHVAMTVDRSVGQIRLYVDGFLAHELAFPRAAPTINYADPWLMGATSLFPADSYRWKADGCIDDVRMYARVLNEMELLTLYLLER